MKAILISINPEWVAKILNGEKNVEVRTTAPRCELPIKVYIYCTKDEKKPIYLPWVVIARVFNRVFNRDSTTHKHNWETINGKVVAKFTLRKVDWFCTRDFFGEYKEGAISISDSTDPAIVRKSCVSQKEIDKYTKGKPAYAWHISDLEIFDEPKELSGFKSYKKNVVITKINGMVFETEFDNSLTKAPQSWCYVEER